MKTITVLEKENFMNFNNKQYYFDGKDLFCGELVWDPKSEEYQLRKARKANQKKDVLNSERKIYGAKIF